MVVTVLDGFGEEQAGGQVFGVFVNDLAKGRFGAILISFVRSRFGLGGVDIHFFALVGVVAEGDGFHQFVVGEAFYFLIVDTHGFGKRPVADCAVGIGADGLLEGAVGFVIPEIEDEVDALVEPCLRFGIFGADGEMEIADSGEFLWRGEIFRSDYVGFRGHGMAGGHLHLGTGERGTTEENCQSDEGFDWVCGGAQRESPEQNRLREFIPFEVRAAFLLSQLPDWTSDSCWNAIWTRAIRRFSQASHASSPCSAVEEA